MALLEYGLAYLGGTGAFVVRLVKGTDARGHRRPDPGDGTDAEDPR